MKKVLKEFFKSKLNITLFTLQCLAILFLCLSNVWKYSLALMLIFEGLFFIFFGIRNIRKNKKLDETSELVLKIDKENVDVEKMQIRNKVIKKGNVFYAFLYFAMGLCLIVIALI